jgi:bifunctional non-homologous end joining protein LigD
VIGGFTPPRNSRPYFGAILVGYYKGDELLYAGKVGSGYNFALLKSLHGEFMKRKRAESSFANLPTSRPRFGTGMTAGEMRKVTWVKPELVCQVRFTEWTDDGMLRHPVFLGLRKDKAAREVVREAAPL